MRLHTTTVRSLSALAVLALAGCTTGSTPADDPVSSDSAPMQQEGKHSPGPELLSSAALSKRLLDESDLGEGYTRKPQQPRPQDDVVVSGCPALEKLGGDAAVGDSLDFPRRAKASFTYTGGSDSEVTEELYSDSAAKLSRGVSRIFDAMISCPTYQVEQWSQLLTYSVGRQRSVVQQTAIRIANMLVVVSGSPGVVDAHLAKAVDKVQRTR
ncbi:hypothetical protein [Streptomyces sp. NRRL B-3229]|uniref:hypothetical protein n=1 Tax=Streptomyces sp. NRRL B-3229 TaxID=1463836 RepID=UPI0004BEAA33|nr:hypothetical protein [Streptomyces sp. NRRL B-3229]